jgi:predicted nucleic acid-binding protein
MRLLVDTDVLLDIALKRDPFFAASAKLLDRGQSLTCDLGISWHTASNFYYIASRLGTSEQAVSFLYDLSRLVEIAPTESSHLRVAAKTGLADFEDAMQVAAALAFGADRIVTRNLKDFKKSPIPAVAPDEAVRLVG